MSVRRSCNRRCHHCRLNAENLAPGLLAHVLVAKYADHLPLYRQSGIYAREGVDLERSTLADWVGRYAPSIVLPSVSMAGTGIPSALLISIRTARPSIRSSVMFVGRPRSNCDFSAPTSADRNR